MFEKIKNTLLEYVECDPQDIKPETEFLKDLKMTSFDIITMLGQLEEEFDITIDNDEIKNIYNVAGLADYLSKII